MSDPSLAVSDIDLHGIDPDVYRRRWAILSVLCLSLVLVVLA